MSDPIERSNVTRRDMLITVATASVLSNFADEASTANAQTSPLALSAPTPPRNFVEVQASLEKSRWIAAKHDLIKNHLATFPWLQTFSTDLSVDDIVFQATSSVTSQEPPYDPYQIESLASAASSLLDRCLVYRRDMYDLEEQAIRRALEYKLFMDQYDPLLSIELAERAETQRSLEQQGQQAAYQKFSSEAQPTPLPAGFAAIAQAIAASSGEAVTSEQERKKNVHLKWQALNDYQSNLQDRHNTPGNPLNYPERYNRIRAFLGLDIVTAFQKIRCVQLAANKIFGLSTTLSAPFQYGYLDYLVTFVRDLINQVEIATIEEVDFEHVVSLHQPRALKSNLSSTAQLINTTIWNAELDPNSGQGILTFALNNEFPPSVKRLRIRAIGMSYLSDSPADEAARLRSVAAMIFLPPADNLFSPGSVKARPPVIVENIAPYNPGSVKLYTLPAATNIDPRAPGTWQVQVSSNMLWPDANAHGRAPGPIKDVKLHFKLSAIVDKTPSAWQDLSW